MTMYHHDARSYETAVNEARETLRANLRKGSAKAMSGLHTLQARVIRDTLTPISSLSYGFADGDSILSINGQRITPQAFGQLCARTQMPVGFARKLLEHESPLARNLVLENLETLSAVSEQKTMLRSVDGVIHGVVSDAYKRMDSRLIVGAFVGEAITEAKLMPVQCSISDTKVYVRALLPRIYGEQFGEALAFGVELSASDFGFGPVSCMPFCERVWCTNRAVMSLRLGKGFRKQHRGARVTEETFTLSAETQELQARALSSELRDSVTDLLSPQAIDCYTDAIGRCYAESRTGKFDLQAEIERLTESRRLSERQAKYVAECTQSRDRDVVPQSGGRWILSQAIAYAAHAMADLDADTRVELEYLAGEIVESAPANALPAHVVEA